MRKIVGVLRDKELKLEDGEEAWHTLARLTVANAQKQKGGKKKFELAPFFNSVAILPTSAKLMYLCMYDSRNGVTQCMRGV